MSSRALDALIIATADEGLSEQAETNMADVGSSGCRCEMKTHLWDSATVLLLLLSGWVCFNRLSSYYMLNVPITVSEGEQSTTNDFRMKMLTSTFIRS